MKELLTIYTYIDGVNDVPFYDSQNPIQVSGYTASMQRMSSCSISATIEYPVCLDNEWDGRQYVTFRGERWFLKNIPSSSYSNESGLYSHSLQFSPERELQLGNVYFYDAVTADSDVDDKYKSNSSKVVFFGTIQEFAARLAASLKYVGLTEYSVVVDDDVESEALQIEFEDRTFFEALQDGYDNYNIPFYFVGKVIHFGYTDDVIDQIFKYGIDNELLSIKKENANYKIVTRCAGYGSSDNVPYYYPNNSPKGNIGVRVLAGGPTLSEENIHIIDYATFAAKVEIGERVEFHEGKTGTMGIFVNDEEAMYDGQPREVHLVNLMPIDVKFRILFSISGNGQFKITPTMTLAGSVINPLAGIITEVSLIDYSTKESKGVEIVDYDHIVTDSLDGDVYEMTLKYTLRDVGGLGDYTYSTWFTIEPMPGSWKIGESEDAISVDISKLGIKIDVTPSSGDAFTQVLINKIAESEYLLPPVYRDTLGAERFYNAINNTYTNPETGEKYVFENEYNAKTPHEHIEEFEDIKPTIRGITNAAGQEIGRFLEVAYDLNDNDDTDEDGNYLHPYFFVKLPKFDGAWGFNLFDHAIEDGEMTIAMTSGNCGGCHFVIGVNEVDGKSNIVQVDEDGNLKRDSEGNVLWKGQFAQDVQNDTQNNEVWIALKKDIDTFGVIMPNATNNYKPSAGDSFVILNILLPQAYIDKSENDLKEAIIQYMSENNSEKFNFSIGFSRIYLAENPSIEKRLTENARIKVEYNGSVYTFYISQVSYKAESDVTLPEISVELADTITINRSALQNSIDSVEFKVTKKFDNINFVSKVSPYFIKKNEDDETRGIVRFIRGLWLGENTSENRGFTVGNTSTVTGTLDAMTLLGIKDGVSLSVQKGYIAGLRPFVRRVTESRELTNLDYTILVGAARAITLTTPQSPENGQYYRIYNDSAYTVTISGNGTLVSVIGQEGAPSGTMDLPKTSGLEMFYSKDVGRWFVTIFGDSFFAKDEDGNVYVKDNKGLYSNAFISAKGADTEAGGGGGGGINEDDLWAILGNEGTEQISASHIPALSSLSGKLANAQLQNSSVTIAGVGVALGGSLSTTQIATALTGAGYKLTDTTYGLATDTTAGLIKLGYTLNNKNYPVSVDNAGKAYVNVPWIDSFSSYFGVDENGDMYVKDGRGFYSDSFISSKGRDASASDGGGIDITAMWAALAANTSEQINVSHIPNLSIDKITGLQEVLDSKLTGITKSMVEAVLVGTITSHDHNGQYAPLSNGLIPSQYLPSFVDDVLEFSSKDAFPSIGEGGKIYVALDTNLTYRWGGSSYVEISPSLALGYTSSTAYPGNEGAANASAIATLRGYFTGGAANKVAHALTISYDGGTAVKFDGSTALSVTIPSDEQRALWDKICALFDIDADGNVYVTNTRGFYSNSFLSARGADPEAGQGGTGGLDIDAMWDALATSGAQKIDASHIPALGLLSGTVSNAQLANSSITVAGYEAPLGGGVTVAQIATALTGAGHKLTDTTYGLATDTTAGLVKTGYLAHVGTKNYGVKLNSLGQMYVSVPWTDTVTTLASLGITATAAELNKLDGLATTATELGYVHGVTSNIQTQLNAKANASALAAYALKDGSNASGTWPISISGNAATLGGYGPGTLSRLIDYYASGYLTAVGWYRVFTAEFSNARGMTVMLYLWRAYSHTNNEAYIFNISIAYDGRISITQTSGGYNGRLIDKIRVVWVNSGACYIDFHIGTSSQGDRYYVSGKGVGTFQAPAAVSETVTGNVTEFSTVNGVASNYGFTGDLSGNASSATKLATARSIWGKSFNGENNVSGDMTGVDWINGGLLISTFGSNSDASDTVQLSTSKHIVEFGGVGYIHRSYYFRPQYSSKGATRASVYIQNASASNSPTFTTTHSFSYTGNAYHSGNVGIGTTAPSYKLHVVGTGYFSSKLEVAGTIHSSTGIWSDGYVSAHGVDTTSDRKFKDDITQLDGRHALAVIRELRPSTWTWNALAKVKGRSAGFVAQDVAGILPDAIREIGEDKHLTLNYQILHAYEVAALQEHDDEIQRLRKRVDFFENELKRARSWQH